MILDWCYRAVDDRLNMTQMLKLYNSMRNSAKNKSFYIEFNSKVDGVDGISVLYVDSNVTQISV